MKSLNYDDVKKQMAQLASPNIEISILLDRPHSDMNIAHVFRLCDAAQIKHLYILQHNPLIKWHKVEHLSRKNTNYVPFTLLNEQPNFEAFQSIIALEWTDQSQDIFKLKKIPKSVLLVIGNEQTGIQQSLLDQCTSSIHLPMYGQHSSINMAMATGIAVYQIQQLAIKS